jgi:hypothetical protein
VHPKVVYTAAILLFNHVLCFKRESSLLQNSLEKAMIKITEIISIKELVDVEAVIGLLMCECRILYGNKNMCEFVMNKIENNFKNTHSNLKTRIPD